MSAAPDPLLAELEALLERASQDGRLAEVQDRVAAWRGLDPLGPEGPQVDASGGGEIVTCHLQPRVHGFVGESPAMKKVHGVLDRVAPTDVTVLVLGATGTGKELAARAIHEGSRRKKGPFLAENCAAVPAELLESELFGHAKGSFTGAIKDRDGHFVAASGGTIFLDEIGDMPLPMQAKLLRVLQEGEVRPVGSNRTQKVDVRVVAATNKDLEAGCREGWFREDLYWRLAVVTLPLPALEERQGDVVRLAEHFFALEAQGGQRPPQVERAVLDSLAERSWPGNVRELENEVRRAWALSSGVVTTDALSN